MEFTGQGLRITGHLAEPLAGCELPLLSALPILATLDGPIDPTARTWASATKVALEAVAARRVYPALDGDGRDCWRLAPHVPTPAPDPAIAQFFDAIAETLLRPPGAPLVIGIGRTRDTRDRSIRRPPTGPTVPPRPPKGPLPRT